MMRWKARRMELERNSFMYDIPDAAAAGDASLFDSAHIDATSHPLFFDTAEPSAYSFSTSAAGADATLYAPSFDASQADAAPYAASFNVSRLGLDTSSTYASFDAAQVDAFYAVSSNAFRGSTTTDASSSNSPKASVASYPLSFFATKASATPYHTFSTAAYQQGDANVQANLTAVDCHGIPEDAEMLTRDDDQIDFVAEGTANAITPEAMVVDDGKDIETMETKSLPTCSHEAQTSKSDEKEDDDIDMQ